VYNDTASENVDVLRKRTLVISMEARGEEDGL
jgi:hypothetical protein